MYETIKEFNKQLAFAPMIEGGMFDPRRFRRFIVAGVGGSQISTGLLRIWNPTLRVTSHRDYGLPPVPPEEVSETLVVVSSYSGNTEESLDAFETALREKFPTLAISVGGELLKRVKTAGTFFIQLPKTKIQPRASIGFQVKALLAAVGDGAASEAVNRLASSLEPASLEESGRSLAERLINSVPVIYASQRNEAIAYIWKIKFNETGKIPAFCNVFPELNHNEMTGFDVTEKTRLLSRPFHFIFLTDEVDHPRIQKRMEVLRGLYEKRGLPVTTIPLDDSDPFKKVFSAILLADWAAYYTATAYGVDPEEVPMVEEFKKLI